MLPYMVKELCRCDFIKDLELRRSSWIYPSRPSIITGVLRRERDGRIRIRSGQKQSSEGCEDGRDQKPRDTAASKDCKRQGSRFTPRVSSYFFPVRLVLDF